MEGNGTAGASVDSVDRIDTVSSVETQKEIELGAENIVNEILKDAIIHAEKETTEEPPCEIKNVETKDAVVHAENKETKAAEEKKEGETKKIGAYCATGFLFRQRIEQTIEELKNIDENIKSLTETISRAVIITTVSSFPCLYFYDSRLTSFFLTLTHGLFRTLLCLDGISFSVLFFFFYISSRYPSLPLHVAAVFFSALYLPSISPDIVLFVLQPTFEMWKEVLQHFTTGILQEKFDKVKKS
jgi:hypothetical protein